MLEVLKEFDKLRNALKSPDSQNISYESDKENIKNMLNTKIEPYNTKKAKSNSELQDQLIALSEKILKKDHLLDNLKEVSNI